MSPTLSRRQSAGMSVFMIGLKALARMVRWITGPVLTTTEMMQSMFARLPVDEFKQQAIARGKARTILEWERLSQKAIANLNPESQWTFHKDQWGPHEVSVMPRIIDSNTGVVIGPPEN